MACTTILVGKKASYDGSTMIARNDDSGAGHLYAEKICGSSSGGTAEEYIESVISHVEIELPEQSDALYRHAECSQGRRNLGS